MTEILTDTLHKIAYSTDASIYREVPYGVAYPRNGEDIVALLDAARQKGTHLIGRCGGTSIAGQVVGSGIVVDFSRHMNRIIEIDAESQTATVEPGVVRDELNMALKPYGLFFSPETSTSNRCCIGGMFGNNSCGAHSLVYGSTRHHVVEAKGILADGTAEHFRTYTVAELENRFGKEFWQKAEAGSLAERIYGLLIRFALNDDVTSVIDSSFPDKTLRRRSCGYAIDEVIEPLRDTTVPLADRTLNLCPLLSGSEGTLALVTQIKVSLDPLPLPESMMLCVHCDTLQKCFAANLVALRHSPEAIELMDKPVLDLSRDNLAQQHNRFFINGDPAGILCVELRAATAEELKAKASAAEKDLIGSGLVYHVTHVAGSDMSRVYGLRKAGLGLLSGMKGDAKPIGVIEDTAVAPERLGAFIADLDAMLAELGLSCVYYGHISTGELHLRPIINIKDAAGKRNFREVALRTARLVKKHKGSLSGEHGDGRLRGEFIPLVYGDTAYELMRTVKGTFDPEGLLNIGKIIDTPPMDACLRFEPGQQYAVAGELTGGKTYFNWRAAFDECDTPGASGVTSQCHALMCSVEQCNGAGDCRKSNRVGGTLCPAFKVSGDEMNTTRARANVIREILTRGSASEALSAQAKGGALTGDELKYMLDSCLACKGCRSECPSNVDMTKLRAELLQQRYDKTGTPLRIRMVAYMSVFSKLGMIAPWAYNTMTGWSVTAAMLKKVLGFASQRRIPGLSRRTMRALVKREMRRSEAHTFRNGKVYLFADEFTNYQEARLGLDFARLLMALEYEVEIPRHVESGRAAISKGILKYARKCAERNVEILSGIVSKETPLVGIEPSCILSFRDEYPDLVSADNRAEAKRLGADCLLFDEFLLREIEAGRITAESFSNASAQIWLHGHCHQKSLIGVDKTAEVMRRLLNAKVNVIPSGCCGMAGSFGYEKAHYDTSMAIGEMVLFPAVRKAAESHPDAIVAAPGTSCRHHIKDGTGFTARHPIEILYEYLKP
ncbi:MAG: FAD-linked oxidase C-terminal domain-containing protein [Bacteroidales bacterium]|nr:FAD-linked oxidase C-terminal domain-containing protein [Bacteroidales bacterium]